MPIPPAHAHRHVYHFTHLHNLEGVLRHGFLSCNEQIRRGLRHTSIAAPSIQERRSQMPVPCGSGGVVHDYVPLYFCQRSSMLLTIVRSKNVDQELLVYFAYPISLVERPDVVFTDAAANTVTPPKFYGNPAALDALRWDAIDSLKWSLPDDRTKQMRMAEVLVHRELAPGDAAYLVVWNETFAQEVKTIYSKVGLPAPPIQCDGVHWFTHFGEQWPEGMKNCSIAHGPIWTKQTYEEAVDDILKNRGRATAPRFTSLEAMLHALRSSGLAVLPETAELIGLVSDNEVHEHDVGTHTLKVVERLRASPEYGVLNPIDQQLVELATYLHDIGKGPKSRWSGFGGRQQVDAAHPIRSAGMLPRILTEDVQGVDDRSVRILCKLVCYHDLIGDILGKGRDRSQLLDIAENERDLDMLIALGKADMASVREAWAFTADYGINELRQWVLERLGTGDQ